jgi:hypothetical protein
MRHLRIAHHHPGGALMATPLLAHQNDSGAAAAFAFLRSSSALPQAFLGFQ